jgi:hypothetical protein
MSNFSRNSTSTAGLMRRIETLLTADIFCLRNLKNPLIVPLLNDFFLLNGK